MAVAGRLRSVDLATTNPGTPGGTFMRQFWHAVARSEDLPAGRAVPLRIMNEEFALFRTGNGVAQIIAGRCPHRHALMHLGYVEADAIRCVYHGWAFDGSGQCVEAPAEREGFAERVRTRAYPTGEAFGLIYGYFGDDEPPAFPPYPESQGDGYIETWPIERVPCNYLQSFENSMDEVHVAFTHAPGGSHAKLSHFSRDLPVITAQERPWGMMRWGKRASGMLRHTLHIAPNIVRVIVPPLSGMDGVGGWPEITFHFTPVDDVNHLWVITAKVPLTDTTLDAYRAKRAEFFAKRAEEPAVRDVVDRIWSGDIPYDDVRHVDLALVQDIAVQAGQGPIESRETETLGRSDVGIALWRRILERELTAIANGETPKRWERLPDDVAPIVGF